MPNLENTEPTTEPQAGKASEPDYKALWEAAQADAEKWKALSRKNEGRAKANEDATHQLADLSERLTAIETENATLKADAERRKIVSEVAKDTGVPESIVSTLAAKDKDALTEAAKAIADAYKVPGGAPHVGEGGTFPKDGTQSTAAGDAAMREFVRQLTGRGSN